MGQRILIIDDSQEMINAFKDRLEQRGHEVLVYNEKSPDVDEVVDHGVKVNPQVVLCNLSLGLEDDDRNKGWTIVRTLKDVIPACRTIVMWWLMEASDLPLFKEKATRHGVEFMSKEDLLRNLDLIEQPK